MSKSTDASSRRKVHRGLISQVRRAAKPPAAACPATDVGAVRSHPTEEDTIQALLDLALPRFGSFDGRAAPAWKPWPVSLAPPASHVPDCATELARSPSPCLNLDALSSDDAEESVIPQEFSATLFCDPGGVRSDLVRRRLAVGIPCRRSETGLTN